MSRVCTALLRQMVAHVIEVEGPIYDDVLVTVLPVRTDFSDREVTVRQLVLAAVDRRFPGTKEDGREVFWKNGLED